MQSSVKENPLILHAVFSIIHFVLFPNTVSSLLQFPHHPFNLIDQGVNPGAAVVDFLLHHQITEEVVAENAVFETNKEEKPELDLTALNETIAYSQLVNILKEPDEYLGTPIKVKGIYSAPFNGFSHVYNYTVTIQDNTQCCAQGIEFFLRNENDLSLLPEEGELVTIKGTLDLFEEGKHAYCLISDAMIEQ